MLVKCVCSGCSHSYLADDQVGALTCPRCGADNEGSRNPSDIPDEPMGGGLHPMHPNMMDDNMGPPQGDGGVYDPYPGKESFGMDFLERGFDPLAPPPMHVTGERMLKGLVFGGLATAILGFILGGALAALEVTVPLVAAVVMAFGAGAVTRYGFGGRTAARTTGRALFTMVLVLVLGNVGFICGSWAIERFTGVVDRDADGVPDVAQTREDLSEGLRRLVRERARSTDTGMSMVIDQRISEAERLKQLSDAELDDYLWTQEAQVNQPLLAYAKLKVLSAPVIRLPRTDPIRLPSPAPAGILLVELVLAAFIAMRAVRPR